MEEEKTYDYIARMLDVFNAIDEDDTINGLVKARSIIEEICTHVQGTKLFTEAKSQYDEFVAEVSKIEDKKDRVMQSWAHFLIKVNSAPTEIYVRGVVILALPVVNKFLSEYADQKIT